MAETLSVSRQQQRIAPWMNLLPWSSGSVCSWSPEAVAALGCQRAQRKADFLRAVRRDDLAALAGRGVDPSAGGVALDIVFSRTVSCGSDGDLGQGGEPGKRALLPLFDMANHTHFPAAEYRYVEDSDRVVVRACRDIAKGEEITISYGQKSIEVFMFFYGFLPQEEECVFEFEVRWSEVARENFIDETVLFNWVKAAGADAEIPLVIEVLESGILVPNQLGVGFLRAILVTKPELEDLNSINVVCCTVSRGNERRVANTLRSAALRCCEDLAEAGDIDQSHMMSLLFRRRLAACLKRCASRLSDHVSILEASDGVVENAA
mmetsp:Transcript_94031/g.215189  ORF Transcript_94031/g.215189 Transcript_94031/m.215189 type:complete len:321 (-) Transcript_94031:29-991(-)